MSVAPFFSQRARQRRAALRAMRRDVPDSFVTLVLEYPLQEIRDRDFRQPHLLEASRSGVAVRSMDRRTGIWSSGWADIPPISVDLVDVVTPVMTVGARRYFGVSSTGAFAFSYQQLKRLAARIEARRVG